MKITLKKNSALTSLSSMLGKPEDELSDLILNRTNKADAIDLDDYDFAGRTVVSIFSDIDQSPLTASLYCLGKADYKIVKLFSKLETWGVGEDISCPLCGSNGLYHDSDRVQVFGCFDYNTEPEYDVRNIMYKCENQNCKHIFISYEN